MSNRRRIRRATATIAALSLAPCSALVFAWPAFADPSCTVTSTADAGPGTLRQALLDLAASAGASCSSITIAATGTVALQSGLPLITSTVTIIGPGRDALNLDGGDVRRIFAARLPANGTLTISRMAMSNGKGAPCVVCEDGGGSSGGAIRASSVDGTGSVTVSEITFAHNRSDDSGGAIWSGNIPLTISDSTFTESYGEKSGGAVTAPSVVVANSTFTTNIAGDEGGAIKATRLSAHGSVFKGNGAYYGGAIAFASTGEGGISSSTFEGNVSAEDLGDGGAAIVRMTGPEESRFVDCQFNANSGSGGGAISARGSQGSPLKPTGSLVIYGSTFRGNDASADGGAVDAAHLASVVITNSTFTGNSAQYNGGAVYANKVDGVSVRFVTITGNATDRSKAGGGLWTSAGDFALVNSIVWGNTTNSPFTKPNDLRDSSRRTTLSNDVFTSRSTVVAPSSSRGTGLIYDRSPRLGPLTDNGGPSTTMLPSRNSPALNAGKRISNMPANDQRGLPRARGPRPDIGAVEVR
ncbi:MAG: choice-of-anchor Q domain-containing protein [Actinomycetes bacterium]